MDWYAATRAGSPSQRTARNTHAYWQYRDNTCTVKHTSKQPCQELAQVTTTLCFRTSNTMYRYFNSSPQQTPHPPPPLPYQPPLSQTNTTTNVRHLSNSDLPTEPNQKVPATKPKRRPRTSFNLVRQYDRPSHRAAFALKSVRQCKGRGGG